MHFSSKLEYTFCFPILKPENSKLGNSPLYFNSKTRNNSELLGITQSKSTMENQIVIFWKLFNILLFKCMCYNLNCYIFEELSNRITCVSCFFKFQENFRNCSSFVSGVIYIKLKYLISSIELACPLR